MGLENIPSHTPYQHHRSKYNLGQSSSSFLHHANERENLQLEVAQSFRNASLHNKRVGEDAYFQSEISETGMSRSPESELEAEAARSRLIRVFGYVGFLLPRPVSIYEVIKIKKSFLSDKLPLL